MGRGRGHVHVVRAKQTTELERDRLDIEISSTWDESMEEDFEFDEDGQLLDAFGEEIDTTEVKKAIPGDFYSLIQVPKDASSAEIKRRTGGCRKRVTRTSREKLDRTCALF